MAKKYYGSEMVKNNSSEFACMPQEIIRKGYPTRDASELPSLSDDFTVMDKQINADRSGARKQLKPQYKD